MIDEAGLEAAAAQLRAADPDCVLDTRHRPGRAEIRIDPAKNLDVLRSLRAQGYSFLASLHGVDYLPEEPRLGVIYELLNFKQADRISVCARISIDEPRIASAVGIWPGADFPEREVFDMFGVVFDGHPDLRRILLPEDYEGYPQRRDFPVGGEPILYTFNEARYGKEL